MLTRWAVHLLPSNCRKPFTSKAHGKVSLTQLTAIEAPTKTEGMVAYDVTCYTAVHCPPGEGWCLHLYSL
jgi:hypothetical protein